MNNLRKAAEMALEALNAMTEEFRALDLPYGSQAYAEGCVAITELNAALAQPDPVEVRQGWEYMREKGLLQEPVAWQERQEIQPGKFVDWYLIDGKPPDKSAMPVGVTYEWQPLYTAPPQRKPLTDEEIDCAYQKIWRDRLSDFQTPFDWVEAGIRYAERAHGIGGKP